jgi:hypothetical protein
LDAACGREQERQQQRKNCGRKDISDLIASGFGASVLIDKQVSLWGFTLMLPASAITIRRRIGIVGTICAEA